MTDNDAYANNYTVNWGGGSFQVVIAPQVPGSQSFNIGLESFTGNDLPGSSNAAFDPDNGWNTWSELLRLQNDDGIWYFIFPVNLLGAGNGTGTWTYQNPAGATTNGQFDVNIIG